jgi:hypothetical protein
LKKKDSQKSRCEDLHHVSCFWYAQNCDHQRSLA